jgi:hypothetical protein
MASAVVVCCLQQCFSPSVLRSYLADFISTVLFVFATAGSARPSNALLASSVHKALVTQLLTPNSLSVS